MLVSANLLASASHQLLSAPTQADSSLVAPKRTGKKESRPCGSHFSDGIVIQTKEVATLPCNQPSLVCLRDVQEAFPDQSSEAGSGFACRKSCSPYQTELKLPWGTTL